MSFDVRWTETMRGRLVRGAEVFSGTSATKGGVKFQFTVHGTIADLDRFVDDEQHRVRLDGFVSSELIGRHPVEDGELRLFRPTSSPAVTEMTYRLPFETADGKFELYGVKTVRDDRGLDLWHDTSTLDTVLCSVPAAADQRPIALARGRLRISVLGFLVLFLTMRAAHRDKDDRVCLPRRIVRHVTLRARFVTWFLGRLADIYGNPFVVNSGALQVTDRRAGRNIERDLDFGPRRRVMWADPRVLWRTFGRLRFAKNLGMSIDARQIQPGGVVPFGNPAQRGDVWLDFVADTGDGFAATYSVAYTVSRPTISIGSAETQRGTALVLGGDLVYPTPTRDDYLQRLLHPFAAALPWDNSELHYVLAIPGNHDWYDSLQSFAHVFMSPGQWIGGRRVVQRQSYFALQLPAGWWVLGMDIALDERVDDKQVRFFSGLQKRIGADGSVIVVIAKPAWMHPRDTQLAKNLQFIEKNVVPKGTLRLVLSGDIHHYARYGRPEAGPVRITCGGGGAYTAGTHHLPPALEVDWVEDHVDVGHPLYRRYPTHDDSVRMRRGVLLSLLGRLPLIATLAAVNLVLAASLLLGDVGATPSTIDRMREASPAGVPEAVARGLVANPVALLLWSAIAAGVVGLAWSGRATAGWRVALSAGVLHAAAQLVVIAAAVWLALQVEAPSAVSAVIVVAATVPSAFAAALIVGVYLFVTDRFELHPDIVFAVQGRTEFKSFLRLHIDRAGNLDVFAFGIPEIVRMWRKNDRYDPDDEVAREEPMLIPTAAATEQPSDGTVRPPLVEQQPPYVELIERLRFRSRRPADKGVAGERRGQPLIDNLRGGWHRGDLDGDAAGVGGDGDLVQQVLDAGGDDGGGESVRRDL